MLTASLVVYATPAGAQKIVYPDAAQVQTAMDRQRRSQEARQQQTEAADVGLKARAAYEAGDFEVAVKLYREALTISPEAKYHASLAFALIHA